MPGGLELERVFWGLMAVVLFLADPAPCGSRPASGPAGTAKLTALPERMSVPLGGVAVLRLRYRLPEGARLEEKGPVGGLAGATVLDREDSPGEVCLRILVDRLGSWETGPLTLPYRDKKGRLRLLETEPIRITVQSNLGERPREARLKPIRDIFPSVPWWRRNGAWIAGALALCALLLGVWFRYRRRPAGPKGEPVVPAHLTALGQLDALEREGLFDQGLVKAHYFRLSEILRRYIESLRTFPAAECTTEEIASRVEAPEDRELVKLLRRTDLVKFADRVPDAAEKEADLDLARSYVKQTAPADEAEPAPERPVRGGGAG